MIISTKGIVLRVVKYGETSIICSVFTELLGLQSYLIKGIRSEKKQSAKGNIFRPGNILDLQVQHQKDKKLQYIKEFQLGCYYKTIGESVVKNTLLLFVVDALTNFVQTEDAQEALFEFTMDFLQFVDEQPTALMGNLPVFFIKEAAKMSGYAISENYTAINCYLNTYEGCFQTSPCNMIPAFDMEQSEACFQLFVPTQLSQVAALKFSAGQRKTALEAYLHFLQWHDKGFKPLRSLPVLEAILH